MATNKEIVKRLEQVALFSRCTKSDLKIVARHVESIRVESGRTIVRSGAEGDALFVVLDGTATVERDGRTVAELGGGDYFGELALLDPAPRAATVIATSDTDLAVLGCVCSVCCCVSCRRSAPSSTPTSLLASAMAALRISSSRQVARLMRSEIGDVDGW
jgi:5-deoxy-D-glucuronate isomerase